MSQDALGAVVFISGSQIGNYEAGRSIPPPDVAEGLEGALGNNGKLAELAAKARAEAVAPWLRPWAESEERAAILRTFQPNLIPGLLQTEAYARTIISAGPHTEAQVEEMTRERMARQKATLGRSEPVLLHAIIGEAALRFGEPPLMVDQLRHLVAIGRHPNVHIRVMPYSAGLHAGLTGAFAIATLQADGATVAYVDDLVQGKVLTQIGVIHYVSSVWESISALALPWQQSRDLISKVVDEHEQRTDVA